MPSRRTVMMAAAAAATTPVVLSTAQAASALPTTPEAQNDALVRIMGRTDDGECVWQSSSRIFAYTPTGVRHVLSTRGCARSWWRKEGDHTYRRFLSSLSFYTDPSTGAFIDAFDNPLTGKSVALKATTMRRRDGEYFTPMGSYFPITRERFPQMYKDEPLQLDWRLDNGTVRVFQTEHFAPVARQPIYEVRTFISPADQALDAKRTSAAASSTGWFTSSYSAWLEMGDAPGHMVWHFEGTKLKGLADLDDAFLTRARAFAANFDVSPERDEGPSYIDTLQRGKPS